MEANRTALEHEVALALSTAWISPSQDYFTDAVQLADGWYEVIKTEEDGGRRAAGFVLDILMKFLIAEGVHAKEMRPILELYRALAELNLGHVSKIVQPKCVPHRKTDPLGKTIRKARLLAACDILRQSNSEMNRELADSSACKVATKYGLMQSVSSKNVATWRRALRAERTQEKAPPMLRAFDDFKTAALRRLDEGDATEAVVQWLLQPGP